MLRPLAIGIPLIFVVVIAFVVGMNMVPFDSPYFKYVIIGYVVLFPAALIYTIVGTIRGAKRLIAGGDVTLRERGERTMATVVAARPLNMTMRVGGGPQQALYAVRLKPDNHTPEISVTKAGFLVGVPAVGDRVPVYLDRDNARNFFVDWDASSGAQRVPAESGLGQIVARLQEMAATQAHTGEAETASYRAAPPVEAHTVEGGALEGRARIEGLKPYPDGTYDLDLYVTPRGKSSYRVAARVPVPAGTGVLQRGQTLKVRVDPEIASRVEVVWD